MPSPGGLKAEEAAHRFQRRINGKVDVPALIIEWPRLQVLISVVTVQGTTSNEPPEGKDAGLVERYVITGGSILGIYNAMQETNRTAPIRLRPLGQSPQLGAEHRSAEGLPRLIR
jgi:hypothetical protein